MINKYNSQCIKEYFEVKNLYGKLEWVQNHPGNFDKQSILLEKYNNDRNISRLHNCQAMSIFLCK